MMATSKTKHGRDYKDRFVRYTQARERNRKAACRQAGEKLRQALADGQLPEKTPPEDQQASAG